MNRVPGNEVCLDGGLLVLAPAFSEDNNANILGLANDSRNQICT